MGTWPLIREARDFVVVTCIDRQDEALMILFFSDTRFDNLIHTEKKTIRGVIHVGGWHLDPISRFQTRVTRILEVDMKGSLSPDAIKKD